MLYAKLTNYGYKMIELYYQKMTRINKIADLANKENFTLMQKASLGVNFINVKRANFSYEHRFSSYVLALSKNLYKKFARLTLMKLTEGRNSRL